MRSCHSGWVWTVTLILLIAGQQNPRLWVRKLVSQHNLSLAADFMSPSHPPNLCLVARDSEGEKWLIMLNNTQTHTTHFFTRTWSQDLAAGPRLTEVKRVWTKGHEGRQSKQRSTPKQRACGHKHALTHGELWDKSLCVGRSSALSGLAWQEGVCSFYWCVKLRLIVTKKSSADAEKVHVTFGHIRIFSAVSLIQRFTYLWLNIVETQRDNMFWFRCLIISSVGPQTAPGWHNYAHELHPCWTGSLFTLLRLI